MDAEIVVDTSVVYDSTTKRANEAARAVVAAQLASLAVTHPGSGKLYQHGTMLGGTIARAGCRCGRCAHWAGYQRRRSCTR